MNRSGYQCTPGNRGFLICGRGVRAFSIAEILVVLAILALGSTIALWTYASYQHTLQVRTTARSLAQVLMRARSLSIDTNLPYQVVINIDRGTFWVDKFDQSKTNLTPKVVQETSVTEFVRIAQVQIGSNTFTEGIHEIPFDPDGSNPFLVVHLIREFDDASLDESYTSVRLFPSAGEPEVVEGRRL